MAFLRSRASFASCLSAVAAVAAATLLLGACGGDDDGGPATPDASSTPDAAPAPDVTPPPDAMPDARVFARTARVTTGQAQELKITEALAPITFTVTDDQGDPVANLNVTITASAGVHLSRVSGMTEDDGTFTVEARAGRHVGLDNFVRLDADDTEPGIAIFTANDWAAGTIIPLANRARLFGILAPLGPTSALETELKGPWAITQAPAGGMFVGDYDFCVVNHVDADGVLTRVAGTGSCVTDVTEGGQASETALQSVWSLAHDPVANVLYIGVSGNKIRKVDLTTGIFTNYAGTGQAPPLESAEGQTATAAKIGRPDQLALGPDGLYVSEANGRVIRIDGDGIVHDVLVPQSNTTCASETGIIVGVSEGYGMPMDLDDDGNLYMAAMVCGSAVGGTTPHTAVFKRTPEGVITWIAGTDSTGNETSAMGLIRVGGAQALHLDGANNLLLFTYGDTIGVRRITIATGATTSVIGVSGLSDPPDYVTAAATGLVSGGGGVRLSTGQIVIADYDLWAVREIR